MIVDSHSHVAAAWYEPGEALLAAMDRAAVERAWLVQLLGIYDNRYQQAQQRANPDRFVSIVGLDWEKPDAADELRRLADAGAWGVRLRPGSRSPGADSLGVWRAAMECRLVVSCVGTAKQFADDSFADVVRAFPQLIIVLEHLGGLARPDVGELDIAMPAILSLAGFPSLRLKLPGLGQILPRSKLDPPPARVALLDTVLDAFGPDRLLWASDFPVVSSREGYANALGWVREALPLAARPLVLGGNAAALIG